MTLARHHTYTFMLKGASLSAFSAPACTAPRGGQQRPPAAAAPPLPCASAAVVGAKGGGGGGNAERQSNQPETVSLQGAV